MSQAVAAHSISSRRSTTVDRTLFVMIVGGLLAALVVLWDATRDRSVNAGDLAPEFSITTEDGRTLTRSNFGGKVLVLNFWASWCGPCREETPSMEQFHKRLKDQGVVLLGISVDKSTDKYKAFLKRYGVTFPTLLDDPNGYAVSNAYGLTTVPTWFLIGQDAEIEISSVGWVKQEMEDANRRLAELQKTPLPPLFKPGEDVRDFRAG